MAEKTLRRNGPARDNQSAGVAKICEAAREGDVDQVGAILKRKPELARRDGVQGYQAIHYAAREGHLEVVKLLLDAGASPTRVTYRERVSAIDMAAITVMSSWLKRWKRGGCGIRERQRPASRCAGRRARAIATPCGNCSVQTLPGYTR